MMFPWVGFACSMLVFNCLGCRGLVWSLITAVAISAEEAVKTDEARGHNVPWCSRLKGKEKTRRNPEMNLPEGPSPLTGYIDPRRTCHWRQTH